MGWERNPVDILIATPISGAETVYYEVVQNRIDTWLDLPQGLKVIHLKFPEPCIDITRDKAVQIAIQNGAKWLWFLDADVIPPRDALKRLMAHDKPIVGGLYVRRHNPPFNEMLKFRTDGFPGLRPIQDGEYIPNSLVECDAIATGCMLIKTDVIEKIRPHQMTIDGQPARPQYFLWTEWRTGTGMSEDFQFCVLAKKSGIPIFCDTSVQCAHVGALKFKPSGNNSLAVEFLG